MAQESIVSEARSGPPAVFLSSDVTVSHLLDDGSRHDLMDDMVMHAAAFRLVISVYALIMAGLVFFLLVGAGWGYGYYGYKDKSSGEMLVVALEYLLDGALLLSYVAIAALIWKRTIGAWAALVMLGPALVTSWWLLQCSCLPKHSFEFAAYALSIGGFVLVQQYRKRLPRWTSP